MTSLIHSGRTLLLSYKKGPFFYDEVIQCNSQIWERNQWQSHQPSLASLGYALLNKFTKMLTKMVTVQNFSGQR